MAARPYSPRRAARSTTHSSSTARGGARNAPHGHGPRRTNQGAASAAAAMASVASTSADTAAARHGRRAGMRRSGSMAQAAPSSIKAGKSGKV